MVVVVVRGVVRECVLGGRAHWVGGCVDWEGL